ncbi:MAG: LptA/OstA family protein [Acidobacteriota bacterium]
MRRVRWLLPVAILFILGAVSSVYLKQRDLLLLNQPERPKLLDGDTQGTALAWCYEKAQGSNTQVEICADKMNSVGSMMEMQGVRLKLFHGDAKDYDLVTSDLAKFNQDERKLFSEGNVEITLAVPVDGAPPGRLLKIHSKGVDFASETGEASTTQPVSFEFDRGGGSSVGAHYNPATRELRMESQVVLDWKGKTPETKPMHIEAGQAYYFENESKVLLYPWAKLTRATLSMEAGPTEVLLKDGDIQQANAKSAHGVQEGPGRKVEFAALDMHMQFDDHMTMRAIQADKEAKLVSTAAASRTTVNSNHLDLNFTPMEHESILTGAVATGSSSVNAEPIARPGAVLPESRVLRSDVIRVAMRPGGEEIDTVETDGPGTLDFLPNRPEQAKRNLTGDRIWINYGEANHIERFRSVNAVTRTERPGRAPMRTESKDIVAFFDANNTLTRMEQNTAFKYEEGDRRANANKATFDQGKDLLTLDGAASTSDPTTRVTADVITLNQKTSDYTADGNVSTTRQPTKKGNSSALLSNEDVRQATAKRMTSTNNGQRIHYEGAVKAWQGPNRVTSDTLDIDQEKHVMEAHGNVETQFADKTPKEGQLKGKAGPAIFTVVRAPELVYTEQTRLALYQGGVHLERQGQALVVDSRELRAFLSDSNAESSLEKAIADGNVKIVSTTAPVAGSKIKTKRVRTGTSEHAEYYTTEQKVILNSGCPVLVDNIKGRTTARELIWWSNDDRLQESGEVSCPAETRIKK